jgi:hypothetical protein
MGSRNNLICIDVAHGSVRRGKCVIRSEKKSNVIDNISLQVSGINMSSFGFFSSIVPAVVLWKPILPPELQ